MLRKVSELAKRTAVGSSLVTVIAELRLKPDCVEKGKRDLIVFARKVRRREPDCLSIEVVHNLDEPTHIALIETWTSRGAYEGPHLQTQHMKVFVERSSQYFDGSAFVTFYESAAAWQGAAASDDNRLRVAPYGR
jgi:quinol monooxygenase YgiN